MGNLLWNIEQVQLEQEREAEGLYTAGQIRDRYRYYKGGGNSPSSPKTTQSNQIFETKDGRKPPKCLRGWPWNSEKASPP